MKTLPHCHPVEAQLLAFTTAYDIPNVLEEFQKKLSLGIYKVCYSVWLFLVKENLSDLGQILIF